MPTGSLSMSSDNVVYGVVFGMAATDPTYSRVTLSEPVLPAEPIESIIASSEGKIVLLHDDKFVAPPSDCA